MQQNTCLFHANHSAMSASNRTRDDFGPITRNRSSSANEASKPIVMLHRRPTHLGNKPSNFSPSNGNNGGKCPFHASSSFSCVCAFLVISFNFGWANWVIFIVFFYWKKNYLLRSADIRVSVEFDTIYSIQTDFLHLLVLYTQIYTFTHTLTLTSVLQTHTNMYTFTYTQIVFVFFGSFLRGEGV